MLQDGEGVTALALAASRGQADLVRLLLSRGADAGIPNHQGRTPLMLAQAEGRKVTARLLQKQQ